MDCYLISRFIDSRICLHYALVFKLQFYGMSLHIIIFLSKLNLTFYNLYIFQTFTSFFGIIWDSLLANLGKPPFPSKIDNFNSYKSLIFTSLLGGVVIWISYQAQLTSKLSIDLTKFPFNDLESLSKTNYM